ncbi:MAG: hypothetical protein ACJ8IQ_01290 [Chthoniobacterales bacterium]
MKSLFGALLCFVLAQSQAWAISGGPIYPGTKTSVVGTYAGVLSPAFCAEPNPANCPALNSIGVFSLAVPSTGNGTGAFTMFARGRVFTGTITASADPNSARVQGILQATYNFNLQKTELDENGQPHVVSIPVTATINGPIDAKISNSASGRSASIAAIRLTGDATMFVNGGFVSGSTGEPIIDATLSLKVNGFKQSSTAGGGSVGTSPTSG